MPSFEETLTCPVCLDLFDDPRLLPCSHTFCWKCLHATGPLHSMFVCPLCRARFLPQVLPINRIVVSLVEQHRHESKNEHRLATITAKCYDCKSYSKLDLCFHCDILLCHKCHYRHQSDWQNRDYRMKTLLLAKVNWLKFQVHLQWNSTIEKQLKTIECQLRTFPHANNRQQYHDNKHQIKSIADDLRQIQSQIRESSVCTTPLSATSSSGYGSDMN